MTNYTDACETLKNYPDHLISNKKDPSEQERVKEAAEGYREHLATHTELKNYIQDAPILCEALAGCYLKELAPLYRRAGGNSKAQAGETLAAETQAGEAQAVEVGAISVIPVLEKIVCCLLECLAELCIDRTNDDSDEDQISTECRNRRDIVRKNLEPSLVSQIAEGMIRKSVSARSDISRIRSVECCAVLARRLGSLDIEYWLKIARLTCECVEAPQVRRAGVVALGVMSKNKLSLGKKTTALSVTHELSLCVSALADILASDETDNSTAAETLDGSSGTSTLAKFSLSVILQLLQDPDRQNPISWTTWLGQLLDDRFSSNADEEQLHGGLCFLNLLYSGATEEFLAYSSTAVLPLRVLPMVMKSEHRPLRIRTEASRFLINCTDWPTLREMLMKAEAIDLLSPLILEEARVDDPELQASVLAILAKLMLHGAEVRELLSDTIPFWDLLIKLASNISSEKTCRDKRISLNLVIVLSALSFHQEFKAQVLGLSLEAIGKFEAEFLAYVEKQSELSHISAEGGDGGTPDHPLIQPGSVLDQTITKILESRKVGGEADRRAAVDGGQADENFSQLFEVMRKLSLTCGDGQGSFHIVLSIFNLVRSTRDKRLLRKTKDGPDFDEHQLRELEMMYEKLPENAKVKERLQYISGGLILSSAVRKLVLQDKTLLSLLIKVGTQTPDGKNRKSTSQSLISMCAQTVRYLASLIELRPVLVSQGGLSVLSKALSLDPEDKHSRFALVAIVATVRPESHRYETRMSCAHQALKMIDTATEELYVHIAARSLVNLTSQFDDVSARVFDGGAGWRRLEAILTDWSDATSAYGAEIMCNIVAKDDVNLKIAELINQNRMPWTVTLIFAYAADDSCKARQLACMAILSYLTRICPTAQWMANGGCQLQFRDTQIHATEKILELWLNAAGTPDNFDAQARLSLTVLNILFYSLEPEMSEGLQTICQKLVLSIGIVWNQIDERCRTMIENTVKNSELSSEAKSQLNLLIQKAPSQQIRDIWAKLLAS